MDEIRSDMDVMERSARASTLQREDQDCYAWLAACMVRKRACLWVDTFARRASDWCCLSPRCSCTARVVTRAIRRVRLEARMQVLALVPAAEFRARVEKAARRSMRRHRSKSSK